MNGDGTVTIAQISDLHCGSPHFVPSLLDWLSIQLAHLKEP